MPETILVVAEQHEGKLNRVSWETIAGAQVIAGELGWQVEAAVVGSGVNAVASELAGKKVAKVYAIESPALANYTPHGLAAALKQFIGEKKPHLVLMPHTYQLRDFAPKLAAALERSLIPDCIGYKKDGNRLLFIRQMFQGKFAAAITFAGKPAYLSPCQ